jgi:hypothetical protein
MTASTNQHATPEGLRAVELAKAALAPHLEKIVPSYDPCGEVEDAAIAKSAIAILALPTTQAERAMSVNLGLAELTCEQLRTRLNQAGEHIERLEAELEAVRHATSVNAVSQSGAPRVQGIATWQERMKKFKKVDAITCAMFEEITDLRAALASRATADTTAASSSESTLGIATSVTDREVVVMAHLKEGDHTTVIYSGKHSLKDATLGTVRLPVRRATAGTTDDSSSNTVKIMRDLLYWAENNICLHEETHRGGAIWEICDACGAKWADDEGGKPASTTPAPLQAAHDWLAAHTTAGTTAAPSQSIDGPEFRALFRGLIGPDGDVWAPMVAFINAWGEQRTTAVNATSRGGAQASALAAALERLEEANDVLCGLRTREQYLSMIDGGQQDALYELDNARKAARDLLKKLATDRSSAVAPTGYLAAELPPASLVYKVEDVWAAAPADVLRALVVAEAALSDIGDADREPGDDLAWCERRAAKELPEVRAVLAAHSNSDRTHKSQHIASVVAGNLANRLEWASEVAQETTPVGTRLYSE